jgi:hypothetical protein
LPVNEIIVLSYTAFNKKASLITETGFINSIIPNINVVAELTAKMHIFSTYFTKNAEKSRIASGPISETLDNKGFFNHTCAENGLFS